MTPADASLMLRTWPPPTELRSSLARSAAVATIVAAQLDDQTDAALAQMLPAMITAIRNVTATGRTTEP